VNDRWPLRLTLALLLFILIIVGFQSSRPSSVSADASSTIPSGATTTLASTTTTVAINRTVFAPPGRGCHVNLDIVTSTATSPSHPTLPLGHCTVLEVGDSIGNDLGWALTRELAGTPGLRLVQDDKSSTGLANAWFYNWPVHLKTFLAQSRPELTVVSFGANDEQGMEVNGHAVAFGTAAWKADYLKLVGQIDHMITATGSYVLWVGLPIVAPNGYRQGINYLNSLYRQVAVRTPGVSFLATWDLLANTHGQFENAARVNGVMSVLRASDGIHFSYVGENVYATFVARSIGAIYHVVLTPKSPMVITH